MNRNVGEVIKLADNLIDQRFKQEQKDIEYTNSPLK